METLSGSPHLTFDEFGRPFIIIRDQEKKKRLTGIQAHKVSGYEIVYCLVTHIGSKIRSFHLANLSRP